MKITRRGTVNDVKRIDGAPVLFIAFEKPGNAFELYMIGCSDEQTIGFDVGKRVVMTLEVETS